MKTSIILTAYVAFLSCIGYIGYQRYDYARTGNSIEMAAVVQEVCGFGGKHLEPTDDIAEMLGQELGLHMATGMILESSFLNRAVLCTIATYQPIRD